MMDPKNSEYFNRLSTLSIVTETIVAWKSKGFSNEKIKPPATANNSPSLKMKWYNSKIRVELKGSCLKQDKVTFTPKNVVNLSIACELDTWSENLKADFILKDYLWNLLT